MQKLTAVRKFIVAAVGIAVTVGLLEPSLEQDIVAALTALAVFLVPNA